MQTNQRAYSPVRLADGTDDFQEERDIDLVETDVRAVLGDLGRVVEVRDHVARLIGWSVAGFNIDRIDLPVSIDTPENGYHVDHRRSLLRTIRDAYRAGALRGSLGLPVRETPVETLEAEVHDVFGQSENVRQMVGDDGVLLGWFLFGSAIYVPDLRRFDIGNDPERAAELRRRMLCSLRDAFHAGLRAGRVDVTVAHGRAM